MGAQKGNCPARITQTRIVYSQITSMSSDKQMFIYGKSETESKTKVVLKEFGM